jgi:hypothetical protein
MRSIVWGRSPNPQGWVESTRFPLAFIQHARSTAAIEATRVSGSNPLFVGKWKRLVDETRINGIPVQMQHRGMCWRGMAEVVDHTCATLTLQSEQGM